MGRRLRAAALVGVPGGRLGAVAVSGAGTDGAGSKAVASCDAGAKAYTSTFGFPGPKAAVSTCAGAGTKAIDSAYGITSSKDTVSARGGAGAKAIDPTTCVATASEAAISAPGVAGAKAVTRGASAGSKAVSHTRSETVSSYSVSTTASSTKAICFTTGSCPASAELFTAVVSVGSLAELLRALLPERGAGGERRRQVGIHLGPYRPRQASQDGLP